MLHEVPSELKIELQKSLLSDRWLRNKQEPYEYFYYDDEGILARRNSDEFNTNLVKRLENLSDLSDPDKIREHFRLNLESTFHRPINADAPQFDNVYNSGLILSGIYDDERKFEQKDLDFASKAWLKTACDYLTAYHFSLGDGINPEPFEGDKEILIGIVTIFNALRFGKTHVADELLKYDRTGIHFKGFLGSVNDEGKKVNIFASCPVEDYGRDWFFTAKALVDESLPEIRARMKRLHVGEKLEE